MLDRARKISPTRDLDEEHIKIEALRYKSAENLQTCLTVGTMSATSASEIRIAPTVSIFQLLFFLDGIYLSFSTVYYSICICMSVSLLLDYSSVGGASLEMASLEMGLSTYCLKLYI